MTELVIVYIMDTGVYLENNEFSDIKATSGYTVPSIFRREGNSDFHLFRFWLHSIFFLAYVLCLSPIAY